jgi:2'-5' RNA ligase
MDATLFAAIFPPPAARAVLEQVQADLRRQVAERVTWVVPERLHVTVFFFGDERLRGVEEIDGMVRWALDVVGAGAFDLTLDGLGVLRHRVGDGHRSIHLDGGGCKPLVDLAGRINRSTNRPPHLTLGRTRARVALPALAVPPITFRAERIALVRSASEGTERGYRVLREWQLPAGAAPWRGYGMPPS